jgi:hypothetical protein
MIPHFCLCIGLDITRLSNKDINFLFEKVLFHPSFKLEDVNVRFVAQNDYYEQMIFGTKDDWDQYFIHVT